jgi:hypothetical protein
MSAIDDIAAERKRQIEVEGWTAEHDDLHRDGVLARAAACYTDPTYPLIGHTFLPMGWPWGASWWKPTTRRRDLVKAAALIVAEIERLDRKGTSDFLKRPNPALR